MQIIRMTPGEVVPVAIDDQYLTVGGKAIDYAARQADEEVAIDLSLDRQGDLVEGLSGGWYVANVRLPAADYAAVETGEVGEDGNTLYRLERQPVAQNRILVQLWGLPQLPDEQTQ